MCTIKQYFIWFCFIANKLVYKDKCVKVQVYNIDCKTTSINPPINNTYKSNKNQNGIDTVNFQGRCPIESTTEKGLFSSLTRLAKIGLNLINGKTLKETNPEFLANPIKYIMETPEEALLPELQEMFSKLRGLEGKNFTKKAYKLMTEFLGYGQCAPKLNIKKIEPAAYFDEIEGNIVVNETEILPKQESETLDSLWHEFTHFIQTSDMIRTYGKGEFLKAKAKALVFHLDADKSWTQILFEKPIFRISKEEKLKYAEEHRKSWEQRLNMHLYDKVGQEKGGIEPNSNLGQQAHTYLDAASKYMSTMSRQEAIDLMKTTNYIISPWDFDKLDKLYRDNLLEQQAFYIGNKLKRIYEAFINQT